MATMLELRSEPLFQRFSDWFEGLEPFRSPFGTRRDEMIRVEESMVEGNLVIRAEMPGIDPERDVDIRLGDGLLTIAAERREEERREEEGSTFSEFRYGSFRRVLRVPRDVRPEGVQASYQDGILTITVPLPEERTTEATKVPISRT